MSVVAPCSCPAAAAAAAELAEWLATPESEEQNLAHELETAMIIQARNDRLTIKKQCFLREAEEGPRGYNPWGPLPLVETAVANAGDPSAPDPAPAPSPARTDSGSTSPELATTFSAPSEVPTLQNICIGLGPATFDLEQLARALEAGDKYREWVKENWFSNRAWARLSLGMTAAGTAENWATERILETMDPRIDGLLGAFAGLTIN